MNQTLADTLPRWDTSNIYTGLDQPDYVQAVANLERMASDLEAFADAKQIRRANLGEIPNEALAATLAEAIERVNDWSLLYETLNAFVYAFVTTDSYNDLALRELSKLEILATRGQKMRVRLQGWIGSLGARLETVVAASEPIRGHAFFVRDTARQSQYLMDEALEELAAELVLDGGSAFGKLQGNVTSQLKVPFERDGKTELLPITMIRNLCFDADAAVRERAYRTELAGWESIRTSVAACLNGVKGTAVTLARRRGRKHVLETALDDNRIDQPTLDAMMSSIREALPMFRRYLAAKANKLGLNQLRWWDLFAPLSKSDRRFTWPEARDFIVARFNTFDSDLGQFAATAFDRRWIDALPRDGKRGGAFCMDVPGVEESRILANFDGSFDQLSTLAHELGHGYHNHCQRGLAPLVRGAPSTLAETASIFCETLIAESTLVDAARDEQLAILETQLAGATQVCLDISSRFMFESEVCRRRADCELSADDFCLLMRDAQAATYADAVDPATYHPYMWLWKPHYYSHEHNFYNFPYAFGHLFALGLFAVFQREGRAFVPRYQQLLRSTAQNYAAPLAKQFGIDITSADFWRDSLAIIGRQAERFEAL